MRHCRGFCWMLAGVIAVALAGCADARGIGGTVGPSSVSAVPAPDGSAAALMLENAPFRGADAGTFAFTEDSCAAGLAPLRTHTTGTGTLVGAYSFDTRECFDTNALTFAGTFTITAANGDTLAGGYAGHVTGFLDDVTPKYAFTATVTGGTGRFAGASGTLSGTGRANMATHEEAREFSGTIVGVGRGPS